MVEEKKYNFDEDIKRDETGKLSSFANTLKKLG